MSKHTHEQDWACTDTGNKERFVKQWEGKALFLRERRQWIEWSGKQWVPDYSIMAKAEDTAKGIYFEAGNCEKADGRKKLGNWADQSQNTFRLKSMLERAAVPLGVSITDFDNDPTAINCLNGIVNLKTGELTKHSPEQLVMKRADVEYLPDAKCPRWLQFLNEVFLKDQELIACVQRLLGYSITGLTVEHLIAIAYGLGANGKTTLFETILEILGDYGMTTEFATFLNTDKRDVRIQEATGKLKGTRLAVAAETDSNRKWNEALAKKLTGGDTLIGAKLHGDSFEFKPSHTLWFQANHLPGFKDASHGFLRRVRVIPFRAKFEGNAIDPNLREKLLAEKPGIFAWLVEGSIQYFKHGLGDTPNAVNEATDQYISDNDVLGRFISECLVKETGATVGHTDTYRAYSDWCRMQNEPPQDEKFFTKAMEERGITKTRRNTGVVYLNCRLAKDTQSKNDKPFNPLSSQSLEEWEKNHKPKEFYGDYLKSEKSDEEWSEKADIALLRVLS